MTKKEVLQKVAKKGDVSRAYETTVNALGLGIPRAMQNRAWQGKVNADVKGTTRSEDELLSKLKKDDSGRHRIARMLTHGMAGTPPTFGAGNILYRDLAAKAMLARSKEENTHVSGNKSNQFLRQLRGKK